MGGEKSVEEDTRSRSNLGQFQSVINTSTIEFQNAVNGIAIYMPCSIRRVNFGMIEACKDDFFEP